MEGEPVRAGGICYASRTRARVSSSRKDNAAEHRTAPGIFPSISASRIIGIHLLLLLPLSLFSLGLGGPQRRRNGPCLPCSSDHRERGNVKLFGKFALCPRMLPGGRSAAIPPLFLPNDEEIDRPRVSRYSTTALFALRYVYVYPRHRLPQNPWI